MENSSFEFTIAIFIHLKINRKLLGIREGWGHTAVKVNILFKNSTCPELYEKLRDCFRGTNSGYKRPTLAQP